MNISSTPFIRNDYWPDYNDINELNKRIDETENEISLVNIRLSTDIENVSNNLNSYINNQADTTIANSIIVNSLNVNYAEGKFANFSNTNTDNAYVENLTVNKPVFDITLNTPHIENTTSLGGNFYNTNLIDPKFSGDASGDFNTINVNVINANTANINNLFVNTQPEPVASSAVLGYDSEGRVIPIHATFDVGFPENADYLYTDSQGVAYAGIKDTSVGESNNLITSFAVKNAIDNVTANVNDSFNIINDALNNVDSWMNNIENDVKNSFNDVNNSFNDVNNSFNDVNNSFNDVNNSFNNVNNSFNNVNNSFNNVNNSFNNVNNTANNLLDNVDLLKNALTYVLASPVANITMWNSSIAPLNIQAITEFAVLPFGAATTTGSDVGGGAKLNLRGTKATLALPGISWTQEFSTALFYNCRSLNQNILLPNGVYNMIGTFHNCTSLNQNILIPNSVSRMVGTFQNCTSLNQNILIPNGVTDIGGKVIITLGEALAATCGAFQGCTSLNQNIPIPDSVTKNMSNAFYGCSSLNQNMYIYSLVQAPGFLNNTFTGCTLLADKYIHIRSEIPLDTSNAIYNCLVNNFSGVNWTGRVVNDLTAPTVWPPEA